MIKEIEHGDIRIEVNFETGQLCRIEKDSTQFMWSGGRPDASEREKDVWANSSPVMFPVVGPRKEIVVDEIKYGMVQHGIARHLPWRVRKEGNKTIDIFQEYDSKTVDVKHKGKEMKLQFPFSYEMDIKHKITEDSVESEFSIKNKSDRKMPYDFGWHPAFNVSGDTKIITDEREYRPKDVYQEQTLLLKGAGSICLESDLGKIYLQHGFGNTMVWGPESGEFISLEPVTGLPARIEDGFIGSFGSHYLEPKKSISYKSRITPTVDI